MAGRHKMERRQILRACPGEALIYCWWRKFVLTNACVFSGLKRRQEYITAFLEYLIRAVAITPLHFSSFGGEAVQYALDHVRWHAAAQQKRPGIGNIEDFPENNCGIDQCREPGILTNHEGLR